MKEQTTVAQKALVIFLLLYVAFGIYEEFRTGFVLTSIDQAGLFVVFVAAAFLLMFNFLAGYVLALLGILWTLLWPLTSANLFTKGMFYAILVASPPPELLVSVIAWSLLAAGTLILLVLHLLHKRVLSVEIFFAIYVFTCGIVLLGGLVDVLLAGSVWTMPVFLLPGIALGSYLVLLLIGYFAERE